jgi:hypothetical protein
MKKKLLEFVKLIFNFFYINWFVIPMAICFYGLCGGYYAPILSIEINIVLWLLIGSLISSSSKKKDEEIEGLRKRNNELFDMLQGGIEKSPSVRVIDKKEYPILAQYQPNIIWKKVDSLMKTFPDMTEQQCLINLEMDLAQVDQMS